MNVVTNEWMDAALCKPWRNRKCLVRLAHGNMLVAKWNGMYWVDGNTGFRYTGGLSQTSKITHFYSFDKFPEE